MPEEEPLPEVPLPDEEPLPDELLPDELPLFIRPLPDFFMPFEFFMDRLFIEPVLDELPDELEPTVPDPVVLEFVVVPDDVEPVVVPLPVRFEF